MYKPTRWIVVALLAIAGGVFALRLVPKNPVAIIRVVDTAGKPIAGAIIRPDGLRPKRINGHWGWSEDNPVKPTPVTTDAYGIARVPYPHYVFEKTETGEISFGVEHTNFCSERPFRVVSAAPPANATLKDQARFVYDFLSGRIISRPEPVVLRRGGIVKVSGYIGTRENVVPDIHAQLASMSVPRKGYWIPAGSGALMNRRVPVGTNAVRLAYFAPTGGVYFGEPATFLSVAEQTNEFCLELKPAFRVSGKLDDTVPHPVKNGRVQIAVYSEIVNTNGDHFTWQTSGLIKSDGTFAFVGLPSGEAKIAVVCDGYKSTNGPRSGFGSFVIPQVFELTNANTDVVIKMEPTATCQLKILDDQGRPLANADVSFWPNILWKGSTIFMGPAFRTEDLMRSSEDFHWQEFNKTNPQPYEVHSDNQGIAIVQNIPSGKQSYAIWHTNYEMQITSDNRREGSINLIPGETNFVTVTMQKTGKEFLQSPR